MTPYNYSSKVATGSRVGGIFTLIFRWKGSVYKLLGVDMMIWVLLYSLLSCIYRFVLLPDQRMMFEKVVLYCRDFSNHIPLTFILGFYVTTVLNRWWGLWNALPWPDDLILYLTSYLSGQVKYYSLKSPLLLGQAIDAQNFPNAGLMEEGERLMMQAMVGKNMRSMFWVPHMWAASILQKAREEQRIGSDMGLRSILDTLSAFRRACAVCQHVDYIQVPLVYSQVVTIACYSFYSAALLGSQFIDPDTEKALDIYVPIITLFQLVLYVGWLKVAESLINPYGEDDDDFQLNWLIDRHINVSHVMGDGLNREFKGYTWEEMFPWLFNKSLAPKQRLLAFAHKMDKDISSKGQSGEDEGRLPNDPAVLQATTLMQIMRGHLEPPPPPPLILQTNTSIPELDPDDKDILFESNWSRL
ncbi:unnamed protein product [Darwinula stevensoni]|uniref:Bestrophin homolog n=1 Tax=Darwinula stevensoni TaxID=69355 RepID=A0A7R8XDB2_9CRUS|nr:unnamed protein product [Darwinula stevensoni]CAG0888507.1 unnamed protein product [Darwinula stevensoni]